MIVGLLGKKQSGKDTSAKLLVEKLGFKRIAFADALKDLTAQILDERPSIMRSEAFKNTTTYLETAWGPDQQLSGREWLQRIGVAVRDVLGVDTWVNVVVNKMEDESETHWVVTDVRFQNEFDALVRLSRDYSLHPRSLGTLAFIRCVRTVPLPTIDTHVSETELDGAKVDLLVTTDSADATAAAVLAKVEGWLRGDK